jgi:hypothetical protein
LAIAAAVSMAGLMPATAAAGGGRDGAAPAVTLRAILPGRLNPDFVVTTLAVTPPDRDGIFSASATVMNRGRRAGNAGVVRLWLNRRMPAAPRKAGDAQMPAGVLAPGASATIVFDGLRAPSASGNFLLRVFVDADARTAELCEANNQRAAAYSAAPPPDEPPAGGVRYAAAGNANAAPPYTNWFTAADSIQAAVDAAEDGDTILVAAGVYDTGGGPAPDGEPSRVIVAKPVTVVSAEGPALTSIVGAGLDGVSDPLRCAYVSNAVLAGFTLTGGTAGSGGGAFCDWGAEVRDCVISGNAAGWGSGVAGAMGDTGVPGAYGEHAPVAGALTGCRVEDNFGMGACSLALVSNCVVARNTDIGVFYVPAILDCTLDGNTGGGVWNLGFGLVAGCTVRGNTSVFSGGGIATVHTVRRCTVEANASNAGGGIAGGGATLVEDCIVRGNAAGSFGGGLLDVLEARNCIVEDNTAQYGGGSFGQDSGRVVGCLVARNTAASRGGGIYNAMAVENCTIVDNRAAISGGGTIGSYIRRGDRTQRIVNSVFSGNTAPEFPDADVQQVEFYETDNVNNCIAPTPGFPESQGNIAADPLFAEGSYRPAAGSPCIDAGANADWMAAATDLDGHPRIAGALADIGAYEFLPPPPPPRPDFDIARIGVWPPRPAPGDTLTVLVAIRNRGPADGDAGILKLWANHPAAATPAETADASVAVGPIAAGGLRILAVTDLRAPASGDCTLRAFADGAGTADEVSEENNQKTASYSVRAPPPRCHPPGRR